MWDVVAVLLMMSVVMSNIVMVSLTIVSSVDWCWHCNDWLLIDSLDWHSNILSVGLALTVLTAHAEGV